jgi:ribosomal protein S18 acetylase RimI-like enzyme
MKQENSPRAHDLESALGKRVSIRLHDKSGGLRDIVGILESNHHVRNSKGKSIPFDASEIAIWREVKPLPDRAGTGAPFSLRIIELEELSNATWPADREVALGKWIARISDGFTLRANSVLPLGAGPIGEPEGSLEDEVQRVIDLYESAHLTPAFVVPLPLYDQLDNYLAQQGWSQKLVADYLVNETVAEVPDFHEDFIYTTRTTPDKRWLGLVGDENLQKIMERAPAIYGAIEHEGVVIGVGRIAVKGSWSIVTRLFIAPEFRRRGLSRYLMDNLTASARIEGATKVVLQVDQSNSVAMALYQSMGFRFHHTCSYRELQGSGANC